MSEEVVATGPKREAHSRHAVSDRLVDRAMGSLATNASPTRIYTGWTICFPLTERLLSTMPGRACLSTGTAKCRLPSSSRANHLWAHPALTSSAMGSKGLTV